MKFLLITLTAALIGLGAAAQLPDSATQGPNPQDIATPEPEYIDVEEPESAEFQTAPAAPASAPATTSVSKPVSAPVYAPVPPSPIQLQTRSFVPPPPSHLEHHSAQMSFAANPTSIASIIAQSYASPQRQFQPLMQQQQQVQQHVQQQQQQQQQHQQQSMQHFVHQQPSQSIGAGHVYNSQSGYQYRRPVFIRRVYRRRY